MSAQWRGEQEEFDGGLPRLTVISFFSFQHAILRMLPLFVSLRQAGLRRLEQGTKLTDRDLAFLKVPWYFLGPKVPWYQATAAPWAWSSVAVKCLRVVSAAPPPRVCAYPALPTLAPFLPPSSLAPSFISPPYANSDASAPPAPKVSRRPRRCPLHREPRRSS